MGGGAKTFLQNGGAPFVVTEVSQSGIFGAFPKEARGPMYWQQLRPWSLLFPPHHTCTHAHTRSPEISSVWHCDTINQWILLLLTFPKRASFCLMICRPRFGLSRFLIPLFSSSICFLSHTDLWVRVFPSFQSFISHFSLSSPSQTNFVFKFSAIWRKYHTQSGTWHLQPQKNTSLIPAPNSNRQKRTFPSFGGEEMKGWGGESLHKGSCIFHSYYDTLSDPCIM